MNTVIRTDDINYFNEIVEPILNNESDYDLFCDGDNFVAVFHNED